LVGILTIGILSLQGAISEHRQSITKTLEKAKIKGTVLLVRSPKDINEIDGLIIPGGESTTIARILVQSGLYDTLRQRIQEGKLPIMGTCAGCVLLAKEMVENRENVPLLCAMDMCVKRNAFGRQKESFEKALSFSEFTEEYQAVFIRAPVITKVWGKCHILATLDQKIVAARHDQFLALSFHPELTTDLRVHRYFVKMIL